MARIAYLWMMNLEHGNLSEFYFEEMLSDTSYQRKKALISEKLTPIIMQQYVF